MRINIPDLGIITEESGFMELEATSDGRFTSGKDGVNAIVATGDGKVEFVAFENRTLAFVNSALGYGAYYPLYPVKRDSKIKAVLMDLDGTSVKSEEFWIWIIEKTTASMLGDDSFTLEESDMPYVSGHSVSEHLQYCIDKYCPGENLEKARDLYFMHVNREMREIMEGRGRKDAFVPQEGLKEFLYELKKLGIKIGLVTSGLYEKAMPEILSAFRTLGMGEPTDFYDAIISAGYPLRKGSVGTLGELSPKPHPWLYAETCAIGLGIGFDDRASVIAIEDSGAGVCSARIAGYTTVGLAGGNIEESGTMPMCSRCCATLAEVLDYIKEES
ncbi:MAG: HAD family phosphatase [Clostridia bacterium]|nr:HAD family phosphatase [Clostridia bacterium]